MVGITKPPCSRDYKIQSIISGKAWQQMAPQHSSERIWQLLTHVPVDPEAQHREEKAKRNSINIKA